MEGDSEKDFNHEESRVKVKVKKVKNASFRETDKTTRKNKLRTSKDVYDRLKWDSEESTGIDTNSLWIGYMDRFVGMCELPFNSYIPGGDVPYHRIYYFRSGPPVTTTRSLEPGDQGEIQVNPENWPSGSIIQWDRENRIDWIFRSGETPKRGGPRPIITQHVEEGESDSSSDNESNDYLKTPENFIDYPSYKFNSTLQRWEPYSDQDIFESQEAKHEVKILTFNVLFDLHSPEVVQSDKRWPYLFDFLEDASNSVDVIALQEVTPSFLQLIEAQPWVQNKYYLSDVSHSSNPSTVSPYGQLLLSKFPPTHIFFCDHNEHKRRFLIPTFNICGNDLVMPIIHLSSDYTADNRRKRRSQLHFIITSCSQVFAEYSKLANVLIVGDTNFFEEEESTTLEVFNGRRFLDLWNYLRGTTEQSEGLTYDLKNPVAACFTGKRSGRLDRFYLTNGSEERISPVDIEVVGNELIDFSKPPRARLNKEGIFDNTKSSQLNFCLSDHYGVLCTLNFASTPKRVQQNASSCSTRQVFSKYTYSSAVVITPPVNSDLYNFIQSIRGENDPSYSRWMPHITLFYRFLEDDDQGKQFEEAEKKFFKLVKKFGPFELSFNKIGVFEHKKSSAIYLSPNGEGVNSIKQIHRRLVAEYPGCYEFHDDNEITPHITIAKVLDQDIDTLPIKLQEWKSNLESFLESNESATTFLVDQIHLISRKGDEPFTIRHSVPLSATNNETNDAGQLKRFLQESNQLPSKVQEEIVSGIIKEMRTFCEKTLQQISGDFFHLVGSRATGLHTDDSDIDLLCLGPEELTHQSFFAKLSDIATKSFSHSNLYLRSVTLDSLVPVARFSCCGLSIDLVYFNGISLTPWLISDPNYEQIDNFSEMGLRCLSGLRDSNALNQFLPDEEWQNNYQVATRFIRHWAKQRALLSAGFCFLGGLSWSLMVAKIVLQMKEDDPSNVPTPEMIVTEFFANFSRWKWPQPVTFHETFSILSKNVRGKMPIHSLAYPYTNNTSRNVTKSTLSILKEELKRGNQIILQSKSQLYDDKCWNDLVKGFKSEFFEKYSKYFCIKFENLSSLEDAEVCVRFLQSKLVGFIVQLEHDHKSITRLHPFPMLVCSVNDKDFAFFDKDFPLIEDINDQLSKVITLTGLIGLATNYSVEQDEKKYSNEIENFMKEFETWVSKPEGTNMCINVCHASQIVKRFQIVK